RGVRGEDLARAHRVAAGAERYLRGPRDLEVLARVALQRAERRRAGPREVRLRLRDLEGELGFGRRGEEGGSEAGEDDGDPHGGLGRGRGGTLRVRQRRHQKANSLLRFEGVRRGFPARRPQRTNSQSSMASSTSAAIQRTRRTRRAAALLP